MQLNELQISELLSLLLSIFDDGDVLSRSTVSNDSQMHFLVDLFLGTAPLLHSVCSCMNEDARTPNNTADRGRGEGCA